MAGKFVITRAVVQLLLLFCNCRPLDGYAFPVYVTESCPRNLTEWKERSTTLNCTQSNTYMCVPDENITELLEFCYNGPQIQVVKGHCMFLNERYSIVYLYDCNSFTTGCPNSNYLSQKAYGYQSCVSIANGCFLAEPTCRGNMSYIYFHTTRESAPQGSLEEDIFVIVILVPGALALGGFVIGIIICEKRRGNNEDSNVKEPLMTSKTCQEQPKSSNTIEFKESKMEENSDAEAENKDKESVRGSQKQTAFSSLLAACDKGDHADVQCLLEEDVRINEFDTEGFSPLSKACQNGHDKIVQILLNNGAVVNLCNKRMVSPLFLASHKGNDITVQLLLRNGADINLCKNDGSSPLYIACRNGHSSTVQLLLDNGADINLCNDNGTSPLWIACEYGHDNIVQTLLTFGADINRCDNNGVSPLYVACDNNCVSTAEYLLDKGANINLLDKKGSSPLYVACHNGHSDIVRLLLENNADKNVTDENGTSPLWVACQNGHCEAVQYLLKNRADIDINLCNNDGVKPIDIALQNKHYSIVEVLRGNGEDTK